MEKTHLGRVLKGGLLEEREFKLEQVRCVFFMIVYFNKQVKTNLGKLAV